MLLRLLSTHGPKLAGHRYPLKMTESQGSQLLPNYDSNRERGSNQSPRERQFRAGAEGYMPDVHRGGRSR